MLWVLSYCNHGYSDNQLRRNLPLFLELIGDRRVVFGGRLICWGGRARIDARMFPSGRLMLRSKYWRLDSSGSAARTQPELCQQRRKGSALKFVMLSFYSGRSLPSCWPIRVSFGKKYQNNRRKRSSSLRSEKLFHFHYLACQFDMTRNDSLDG